MTVTNIYCGGYGSACYYLTDDRGETAVVIDPSAPPACVPLRPDGRHPRVTAILLTHTHYDHMIALDAWRAQGIPLYVSASDAPGLADPVRNVSGSLFGAPLTYAAAEHQMRDGDTIPLGQETIRVIMTPGHTPGSCCFCIGDAVFCGDTLFFGGGYGRCDLPGGSYTALQKSLARLLQMDASVRLFPGHGAPTTVGQEQSYHGII